MSSLRVLATYRMMDPRASVLNASHGYSNLALMRTRPYVLSRAKRISVNDDTTGHNKFDHVKMAKDIKKDKDFAIEGKSSCRATLTNWAKIMLRSILSLLLPYWKKKWEGLISLEGQVENVAVTVENAADAVEKVGVAVEKLSDMVADKLPGDSGTLKNLTQVVKSVSEEAIKDAQVTKDFVHKVEALKDKAEENVTELLINPWKPPGKESDSNKVD